YCNRREIVGIDSHIEDRKTLTLMRFVQRAPQFRGGSRVEAGAVPLARQPRIWPERDIEQLAALGYRAEDSPSPIVDHEHDRVVPEFWRVGNLGPGHLERAVAAQHQRSQSRADLGAERGRHRKSHRGVKTLREIGVGRWYANVKSTKQHV